jgi:rare lipoprotein A
MRFVVFAAFAVLTLGLVSARPASAAWECTGPSYACSSKGSAVGQKAYNKKAYKAAYRTQKASKVATRKHRAEKVASYERPTARKRRHVARAVPSSGGSYGGGSSGLASYYWQGSVTASGQRFNPSGMTAAHRSLPFGTRVLVTNQSNGRSVTVTINDRGPFIKGRIIDLSSGAAGVIGMKGAGVARVSISVLGRG